MLAGSGSFLKVLFAKSKKKIHFLSKKYQKGPGGDSYNPLPITDEEFTCKSIQPCCISDANLEIERIRRQKTIVAFILK